jgi:hypothetical protein
VKVWSSLIGGGIGALAAILLMVPAMLTGLDRLFPVYSPVTQMSIQQHGKLIVFSGRLKKKSSCIVKHGASGRVALHWEEGGAQAYRLVPLLNPDGSVRISSALYESGEEIFIEMAWDQSRVAEAEIIESWDVRLPCKRYAGLHDTVAVIGSWSR